MDRYCVFGNPIAHSKSPEIHAAYAAQTGQELRYEKRLAPLDGFAAAVHAFIAEGGLGANVTLPFKLEAVKVANALTIRAQAAGAVNTLHFTEDGIIGDNTDGAVLPILEHRPAQLVIANRTVATAVALAEQFAALGGEGVVSGCGFADIDGGFDIVINATAASLSAEVPPVSPSVFAPGALAFDMMYSKSPTVFLQFADQHGARLRDGLGMLVEQAAEAFSVWRGVHPATGDVLQRLRDQL